MKGGRSGAARAVSSAARPPKSAPPRPPRAEGFSACDLLLFEEFSEGYWETPLSFAGEEGDRLVQPAVQPLAPVVGADG